MTAVSRWLASIALAAGLGVAAMAPAPARADSSDDWVRVLVNLADVAYRNDTPYYRYGDYGYNDRLIVVRDRYGRPTYYRNVPRYGHRYDHRYNYDRRYNDYRGPRYVYRPGDAHCNHHGKCKSRYYDARYDRRYDNRHYRYDHRDRHDNHRRWRDRDDD